MTQAETRLRTFVKSYMSGSALPEDYEQFEALLVDYEEELLDRGEQHGRSASYHGY